MLTAGLFMVVETLHANGLTRFLAGIAGTGDGLPALLQLAGLGAGAANAVNNLPAYLALEPVGRFPGQAGRPADRREPRTAGDPVGLPGDTALARAAAGSLNVRSQLGRTRPGRSRQPSH